MGEGRQYQERFLKVYEEARETKRGLSEGCSFLPVIHKSSTSKMIHDFTP